MESKKTAVVFGGGGARGIWQVGPVKALVDKKIDFDMVIGSSVGSLNGSLYFCGRVQEMEEIWLNVKTDDVCRFTPWRIFGSVPSFYNTEPLRALCQKHTDLNAIKAVPKQFFINSTNIGTWSADSVEAHNLDTEDELIDALMKSSAAPIAFPAVANHCDAGLTSNYGIAQAVAAGMDRIIVLVASVPDQRTVHTIADAFDLVCATPEWSQLSMQMHFVKKLNAIPGFRQIELVVIQPPGPTGIQLLDFDMKGKDRAGIIAQGYQIAMSALEAC